MNDLSHRSADTPPVNLDGLDDAFLRYIGVESATQRYIQEPYLANFEGCHRVVDLGCGDGDFVALLQEAGHTALGVDGDSRAAQRLRDLGLPVVESDVFPWLAAEADGVESGDRPAWDGLFCAHLVEHLPYTRVLELCHQAARLLRPGGVIVLATPNVAAIHAHLDGYYQHFGHVTFYHPKLLSFFLDHAGLAVETSGANERVPSTLFFPVIRALNEHQVEIDRIQAVSGELLPQHTQIFADSQAIHTGAATLFDHLRLPVRMPRPAPTTLRQRLGERLRRVGARLVAAAGGSMVADVALLKSQTVAPLAELWLESQRVQDQLNDLLARQGTLVRDSAQASRRMEESVRRLIGQIDAPFEAFVVARKPSGEKSV